MTLRRYQPLKSGSGTRWPTDVARAIRERDLDRCVGPSAGLPLAGFLSPTHWLGLEIDHVRASGALGKKSRSTVDNGVLLCGSCHRWKTEHGREARPLLLRYLERFA